MKSYLILLTGFAISFLSCARSKHELRLLGIKNKSGGSIIFNQKIVRNNKYLSFKEKIMAPFISWLTQHDEANVHFIPEGALPIKINGKWWYIWLDDFGFKYAQLKTEDASYDDCIAQLIKWQDMPAQAYLTIASPQNRITFSLDKNI